MTLKVVQYSTNWIIKITLKTTEASPLTKPIHKLYSPLTASCSWQCISQIIQLREGVLGDEREGGDNFREIPLLACTLSIFLPKGGRGNSCELDCDVFVCTVVVFVWFT